MIVQLNVLLVSNQRFRRSYLTTSCCSKVKHSTMADTRKKVVLAYSGGLDTSSILLWLTEQGYQVITYTANVGQDEDFVALEKKALKIGAVKVIVDDLRQVFATKYIWPSVQAGLIYEGRFLLGTAIARPCISEGLVAAAKKEGATIIAHGATGKGNDQVRFELSIYSLYPEVEIFAPWRDPTFFQRFPGRPDLLEYAKLNGIPVSATSKEPWSIDSSLLHISYESGILEDPATPVPKNLYRLTTDLEDCPSKATEIEIQFVKGIPVFVKNLHDNKTYEKPLDIIVYLNEIGGQNGIGRIDIVENRYIGLKSRAIYEAPGATILHQAHLDLEVYLLDREVLRVKNYLTEKMSDYVYNGYWFSPEFEFVHESIESSQKHVTGTVSLKLYKGNVTINARTSEITLYNEALSSMDVQGGFIPEDAGGFIRTQAMRLKEYYRYKNQQK